MDRARVTPEVQASRLCARLLERMGLAGWWTDEGPTDEPRKAIAGGKAGRGLSRSQWTALRLAWSAWIFPSTHATAPLLAADLLRLEDRRAARHVGAFIRGWVRLRLGDRVREGYLHRIRAASARGRS